MPVAATVRALLAKSMDYAGLFPPAKLPLDETIAHYRDHLASPESWMLNRLVLPEDRLDGLSLPREWGVSLLVPDEPQHPLPAQVQTFETKVTHRLSRPTYAEAPLDQIVDAFAKIRTGGTRPEEIPPPEPVATFIHEAARRKLPFKATAGLHHPVRARYPLTYDQNGPDAVMHGFLNVLIAAAFAWHGADYETVVEVLKEEDPHNFRFEEMQVEWRGRKLSSAQIASARLEFVHSFGSCSFVEPVAGLRHLGLLP